MPSADLLEMSRLTFLMPFERIVRACAQMLECSLALPRRFFLVWKEELTGKGAEDRGPEPPVWRALENVPSAEGPEKYLKGYWIRLRSDYENLAQGPQGNH